MDNQNLFIGSKKYIPASDASALAGLTRDYVARLCRSKKVDGQQIKNQWYVDPKSLHTFIVLQEQAREERHMLLAKERSSEYHGAALLTGIKAENAFSTAGERAMQVSTSSPFGLSTIAAHASNLATSLQSSVSQGALQVAQHSSSSASTIIPTLNIFHKVFAVVLVGVLSFSTYAAVNPSGARVALGLPQTPNPIEAMYATVATSSDLAAAVLAANSTIRLVGLHTCSVISKQM
jgi:hypothetical protein